MVNVMTRVFFKLILFHVVVNFKSSKNLLILLLVATIVFAGMAITYRSRYGRWLPEGWQPTWPARLARALSRAT